MTHPSDADADQLLGGALFCLAGGEIEGLLGSDGNPPNVVRLAVIFFLMCTTNGLDHASLTHAEQGYCTIRYFFMATQDIAVDGWSVNVFSPLPSVYASLLSVPRWPPKRAPRWRRALTLLSRAHVDKGSTMNSIGQVGRSTL
jgi:hypothetical protein